jgi:hypothetical protein
MSELPVRPDELVALGALFAPGIVADAAFRERFIRESRAAAVVDHPDGTEVAVADGNGSTYIWKIAS